MWIGVISESCIEIVPEVIEIFDGMDYILHCGGIGDPEILDALSQIAPVAGVIGPGDDPEQYPFERTLFRKWFDVGVYVTNRLGDPARLPASTRSILDELDPQVVLFGQNPGPFNTRIENRLYFNPGNAASRRGRPQCTIGILELEGRLVRGEVIPLGEDAP